MREFRPPQRASTFRTAFAVVVGVALLGLVVVMFLLTSGSHRITYTIADGALTVDSGSRLDGERVVPLGLIHDRRIVTLRGARRAGGTAVPGYCTGRWSYDEIGPVWQATNCTGQGVLVTASDGDRPVLVTPPDPQAFVQAIDTREDLSVALPTGDATWLRILPLGTAIFALVVGGMTVATLLLGPGRMVYRIGEGKLEAATIFGRRSWPVHGLRARPGSAGAPRRIAGTAVGGYHTGLYVIDGQRTRLYATDLTSGVFVEGPDGRVFLSPEDPGAFLDALAAAGATAERAHPG
jgi:hypothetical protein